MKKCIVVFACVLTSAMMLNNAVRADEGKLDATEYVFSDENVVGELQGVEGVSITVRPRDKERSLIHVKTHFVYEMLKSVESM